MNRRSLVFAMTCLLLTTVLQVGCQRKPSDIGEDFKSGGRYLGKGLKSLAGVHEDSEPLAGGQSLGGPVDEDYVPLRDDDLSRRIAAGDPAALAQVNQGSSVPQSRENPGDPGSSLPGIESFLEPTGELKRLFGLIHFETDRDEIKGQENMQIISQIAEYMGSHPNLYVWVEGHCDERGTTVYNLALGSRRSNSVRNLLISEGGARGNDFKDRLLTISYGKERPLAFGSSPDDIGQNRRAQFKTYTK